MRKILVAVMLVLIISFLVNVASGEKTWAEDMYPRDTDISSFDEKTIILEMVFEDSHIQFYVKDWTSDRTLASAGFRNWRDILKEGILDEEASKAWSILTGGMKNPEENGDIIVPIKDFIQSLPLTTETEHSLEWYSDMYPEGKKISSFTKEEIKLKIVLDNADLMIYLCSEKDTLASVCLGDWGKVLEKGIPADKAKEAWEALTGLNSTSKEGWEGNVSLEEFILSFGDLIL